MGCLCQHSQSPIGDLAMAKRTARLKAHPSASGGRPQAPNASPSADVQDALLQRIGSACAGLEQAQAVLKCLGTQLNVSGESREEECDISALAEVVEVARKLIAESLNGLDFLPPLPLIDLDAPRRSRPRKKRL